MIAGLWHLLSRLGRHRPARCGLAWVGLCVATSAVLAGDSSSLPPATGGKLIQQLGVGGIWKLGHRCAVSLRIPDELRELVATVEITTLDGDGVELAYRRPVDPSAERLSIPVKIGRRPSILSAVAYSSAGVEIAREERLLTEEHGLAPTQPLILAVGSAMGLEDLVRTRLDGSVSNLTIASVVDMSNLPESWLDYQACDLIVLATGNFDLLRQVSPSQWSAIDAWIRRGGGCVVSLGTTAAEYEELRRWASWLPELVADGAIIRNPAPLESLVMTDQPLQPFPAVVLRSDVGRVELTLNDSLARRIPWWQTITHGHGVIEVVASDLDHASLAQWKHRQLLWERLVNRYLEATSMDSLPGSATAATSSYLGYSDLIGQLRAALDQFSGVPSVGLAQIAAMLIGLLVLVGPVDYLFSVRWLRRPQLSWLLAGGTLIAAAVGLSYLFRSLRPDRILVNSARILDIDPQTGRLDGHQWSHVYTSRAARLNLIPDSGGHESPVVFLDWQGLPGSGLGGLQSPLRLDRGMPPYAVEVQADGASWMHQVGIPAGGTKSVYAAWSQTLPLENRSRLREMSSVDQLEGEVVNPLPYDLKDTMLLYHRWFYPLKSRMPAGDSMIISAQVIPKDLSRRLNRQQEVDGKVLAARWDPSERGDLDRLLELLMFHRAASGRNYTSLTHRYQPIVDRSRLLDTDCAVLIGRLDDQLLGLEVAPTDATGELPVQQAIDRSWCRILIPVDATHKRNR